MTTQTDAELHEMATSHFQVRVRMMAKELLEARTRLDVLPRITSLITRMAELERDVAHRQTEYRKLSDHAEEMERDGVRLDWCIEHTAQILKASTGDWTVFFGSEENDSRAVSGPTPRAAIDAAMEGK